MNKGLKKVLSYTLITTMVASMALTGFGGGARTVKAAGETYDSASLVNYSTILGRAVDFGILADTLAQTGSHTETNMAVNLYIGGNHANDPDLAGEEPLPFIIGGIQSGSNLSLRISANENPMTINIETNGYVIDNTIKHSFNKENLSNDERQYGYIDLTQANADDNHNGGHKENVPNIDYNFGNFHTVFKRSSSADISNNIGLMIDHISDESTLLANAGTSRGLSIDQGTQGINNYTLDLTDAKYVGKTVYIDVDRNGDLYRAIKSTGGLRINKDTSTVVVFNIKGTDPVILNKFFVNSTDSTTVNAAKDNTESGDKNSAVDTEICQKIIWNIPDAKDVTLNASAGLFLVPDTSADVKINEGSSAGWIATGGKVTNVKSEFHYIYRGRSKTLSSNENGAMHFAMHKSIYSTVDNSGAPVERDDISVSYKEFKFKIYETDSNFDITNAPFLTFGSEDKPFGDEANPTTYSTHNDANSKILFPDIKVSLADFTGDTTSITKYYVIKETNDVGIDPSTGIANNDGKVCIKLVANKVNENGQDVIKFNVTSKYYLTANDNIPWKTNGVKDDNTEPGINMTGNEFSLGGFYNQYKEGGNLKITKDVSGDTYAADEKDKFKVTVTAKDSSGNVISEKGPYNITGGAFQNSDKENEDVYTSLTFDAEGKTSFYIRKGGEVTFNNLPDGTKVTVEETDYPSTYALQTDSSALTDIIIVSGETKTIALDNKYTAEKGNLTITKTYVGIEASQIPNPDKVLLKVSGPAWQDAQNYSWSGISTDNNALTKTVTISNIPVGEYHVSEVVADQCISGYDIKVSAKVGNVAKALDSNQGVTVNVNKGATSDVVFTNTYKQTSSVTVKKVVEGLDSYASLSNDFKIKASYTPSFGSVPTTVNLVIGGGTGTDINATGSGTSTDPYVWTIPGAPVGGKVDFVEEGYNVDKFEISTINGKTSSDSDFAKVTLDSVFATSTNNVITYTNKYEKEKINISLVKKWVETGTASRPSTLEVKLLANNSEKETITLTTESGQPGTVAVGSEQSSVAGTTITTWTYNKTGLDKYDSNGNLIDYTWTETVPSDYALVSNVPSSNNTTTLTNIYPVPEHGTITINKVVEGTTDSNITGGTYYVTLTGADGKCYNTSGTIVDVSQAKTPVTGGNSVTYSNLPVQQYTLEEDIDAAKKAGYTLKSVISGNDVSDNNKVTLTSDGDSKSATITNTYAPVGSLKITKAKATDSDAFPTGADEFPIEVTLGVTGKYLVRIDGTSTAATEVEFTAGQSKELPYEIGVGENLTISDIPANTTFSVSENLTDSKYVNFDTALISDAGNGTIAQGTTSEVTVTNKYTAPAPQPTTGYLKVTKAFNAEAPTAVAQCQYTFTVSGPQGNSSTDRQITITGANTETIADLPIGVYTVTENTPAADHISGYTFTGAANSGTTVEVKAEHVDADHAATITITNNYTQNSSAPTPTPIDVTCSKRETGKTEELSGASMQLIKDGVTTPVATWTSGSSAHVINGLGEGTYTLKEVNPPTDYEIAAPITFTIVDDNGTLVAVDANNQPYPNNTIVMFDNKAPMKEVSFSKVDAYNSGEIAGAELTLYKYVGGVQSTVTNWTSSETEVYKFTIGAGDYGIEEIVAPSGYETASSLVRFTLTFDANGNAAIVVSKGPGEYDATNDVIKIKDDPIRVTGKLSVHVEEKKTGRPVPGAEVEVTGLDGTTKTYKTNGNGEIVDENGNTPIDVPAGKYKVTVKKVPAGYEVETGQTAEVEVPENKEGRHIAKIVSSTGGLKIKVLEEGTNREVPDATVVVEAPEGVKFPDGSTKITAITDKNGNITTYTGADGKTYDLTSGLTPGDYKITVTKVPAGYNVTVGETKTCKVVKDEIAEHVALIATSSNVQPAPAPAPAATPAATPATPTGSITNSINVKTGDDMNVYPALIAMALSLITGVSVVAFRRKRETK